MSDSGNIDQIWQWQTWQDYSYLTCSLLSAWQHGFFTQQFYPRTPEDLTSILQSDSTAYRLKQVHGNVVLTTKEINTLIEGKPKVEGLKDGDAVMSDRASSQSVWAASADCTPILIGDVATGIVCAIHAGWRGTSKKIAHEAIARLVKFGSNKENLRIAIGPAIAGKVYQVDDYVAVEVGKTIVKSDNNAEIIATLKQLPQPPILPDELPGKVRLDVPRINYIQFTQLGINPENIAIAPYCTYQQEHHFFSYRRTGEKKVQWSGILSL